jgi:iron complex transport system substrate-binding protein
MRPARHPSNRLAVLVALLVLAVLAPAAEAAPKPRIVALTPFAANTLAQLKIKPLAIGQTLGGSERFHPALRRVRTLPLAHPNGPNMEQLATLRPRLVFSSPAWRKGAQTMRRLDMRVEEADPGRITDLARATRRIGELAGRPKRARRLARRLEAGIRSATANIERRPRVLMVLGVGRTPYAFLPNSWGGDLVTRAGGQLITAGVTSSSGFARISDEKVIEADPDVILAVPHANPDDIDDIKRSMEANELWKLTRAGMTGNIFVSTDNSLLQAGTDVAQVIRTVRQRFLKNW